MMRYIELIEPFDQNGYTPNSVMASSPNSDWVLYSEARAEIDALKAQNAELLAAQQWQPIESAPKDGESVLILFGEADVVVVAHWDGDNECWCESWLCDELTNGHAKKKKKKKKKKWRPLPLPPAIAKARGEQHV